MSADVPNLRSFSFTVPAGETLVLAQDKDRRLFSVDPLYPITNPNQQDVRLWWGPLAPPLDPTLWRQLPDDGLQASKGVQGPIYIRDVGSQATQLFISSSINEDDAASIEAVPATFARTGYLVTENGDRLVTEDGDPLIAYF